MLFGKKHIEFASLPKLAKGLGLNSFATLCPKLPHDAWCVVSSFLDLPALEYVIWSNSSGVHAALPRLLQRALEGFGISGHCILAALRRARSCKRANVVWKLVATAQLTAFKGVWDFHEDRYGIRRLQSALTVALAARVDDASIKQASQVMKRRREERRRGKRNYFDSGSDENTSDDDMEADQRAVTKECEYACKHNVSPNGVWIRAWLEAGSEAAGLEILLESSLPVKTIYNVFGVFQKFSKYLTSGLTFPPDMQIIRKALGRRFASFSDRTLWKRLCQKIIVLELERLLFHGGDFFNDLEELTALAIAAGVPDKLTNFPITVLRRRLQPRLKSHASDKKLGRFALASKRKRNEANGDALMQCAAKKPGVMSDAILRECWAATNGETLHSKWINSWLRVDSLASVNKLTSERGRPPLSSLEVLVHSGLNSKETVDVIRVLIERGGRARGEFILRALYYNPGDAWKNEWIALWSKAASAQLSYVVVLDEPIRLCYGPLYTANCTVIYPFEAQASALAAALATGVTNEFIQSARSANTPCTSPRLFDTLSIKMRSDVKGACAWLRKELQDNVGTALKVANDEYMSVHTGSLLEAIASASFSHCPLLEPVAILSSHGGIASGQHILHALRKLPEDATARTLWVRMWGDICKSSLSHTLMLARRQRRRGFENDEEQDYFESKLHDAMIASLALGVDASLLRDAKSYFQRDGFGGIEVRLKDTILEECRAAVWLARRPTMGWLSAWLQFGAESSGKQRWLADAYNECELSKPCGSPVGVLVSSALDPDELVESVCLLIEYGDYGGMPFRDGFCLCKQEHKVLDPIIQALAMVLGTEVGRCQWERVWKSAAAMRFRTLGWEDLAKDSDTDFLRDSVNLAVALGVQDDGVEKVKRTLAAHDEEEERDKMEDEDCESDRLRCVFQLAGQDAEKAKSIIVEQAEQERMSKQDAASHEMRRKDILFRRLRPREPLKHLPRLYVTPPPNRILADPSQGEIFVGLRLPSIPQL